MLLKTDFKCLKMHVSDICRLSKNTAFDCEKFTDRNTESQKEVFRVKNVMSS